MPGVRCISCGVDLTAHAPDATCPECAERHAAPAPHDRDLALGLINLGLLSMVGVFWVLPWNLSVRWVLALSVFLALAFGCFLGAARRAKGWPRLVACVLLSIVSTMLLWFVGTWLVER